MELVVTHSKFTAVAALYAEWVIFYLLNFHGRKHVVRKEDDR